MLTVITFFVTMHCLTAQVDKIAQMTEALPDHYMGSVDERYLISVETNSTYKLNIYLPISYNVLNFSSSFSSRVKNSVLLILISLILLIISGMEFLVFIR